MFLPFYVFLQINLHFTNSFRKYMLKNVVHTTHSFSICSSTCGIFFFLLNVVWSLTVCLSVTFRCNRRDVDTTRFKVEDLTEGDEYEFRVIAYNAAGASRPSTTAGPIVIQDQTCTIILDIIIKIPWRHKFNMQHFISVTELANLDNLAQIWSKFKFKI